MKALAKLFPRFAKRYSSWCARRLESKAHQSIDTLPIYNWWKIHQTGELTLLLLFPEQVRLTRWKRIALASIWDRVYNQYIKRFGIGRDFLRILNKRKEIASLKNEKLQTGDLSIQTFIDIAVMELNRLLADQGESDFFESKANMERRLGFVIDPRRISVAEFYSYISSLKKNPHGNQRPD